MADPVFGIGMYSGAAADRIHAFRFSVFYSVFLLAAGAGLLREEGCIYGDSPEFSSLPWTPLIHFRGIVGDPSDLYASASSGYVCIERRVCRTVSGGRVPSSVFRTGCFPEYGFPLSYGNGS